MRSLFVTAAAALMLAGGPVATAAGRSVTNINRDDGWLSVRRDGEPMVTGSGRMATDARSVGRFQSVHVMGPTRLELTIGPRASVEIVADDNLLGLITSRVQGGELRVDTGGSFRTRTAPLVRITTPRLDQVRLVGSGDGRIEGLTGGALTLISQGSGDLSVSGRLASLDTKLCGSGDADLTRVSTPDLRVAIYGSGDARVHASGSLSASVFGSGTIAYSGRPRHIHQSIHGSGSIRPIGR